MQDYDAITRAKNQAESGNTEGAIRTLEEYLATDPHNTKPRLVLADIAIHKADDIEYGMMQLDIILDLEPDNLDAMKAKATVLASHKKNNRETLELFEKIVDMDHTAESYNEFARFLRNQLTDFKRAGEYYEKAIACDPSNFIYHQNYAVLLLNDLKDYPKAKVELEILMELKPGDKSIRDNYTRLMTKKFDSNGNVKKSLRDRLSKR